ncbi:hypothetical protein [Streptomyces sp. HF10]|uniref:hypothetical protein n=1 Tax=Streptomyces sp. HF10 TaxID=2692233 RepID=UPI001F46C382|nr:hypothetical protein [Streptomyces sp. HF10]
MTTQLRLHEVSRGLGGEWPSRLAAIEAQARPLLAPAAAARLGPARISTAAARSRSTTGRRTPGPKPPAGPEASQQAPHLRNRPDPKHDRGKGPTA